MPDIYAKRTSENVGDVKGKVRDTVIRLYRVKFKNTNIDEAMIDAMETKYSKPKHNIPLFSWFLKKYFWSSNIPIF